MNDDVCIYKSWIFVKNHEFGRVQLAAAGSARPGGYVFMYINDEDHSLEK